MKWYVCITKEQSNLRPEESPLVFSFVKTEMKKEKKEKDAAILMTLKKHKVYVQSGMYLRGQKWPLLCYF